MSMNDLLSDLLARIKNAQGARLKEITAPASKLSANVCEVLKAEGYIESWEKVTDGNKSNLRVVLKYFEGEPVIREMKRISKPGRREYSKITDLPKVHNGLGIAILSTSKGVLSDAQAREQKIGGEVLCSVF